ncbi:gamma-glutamyltransferase family protein [Streptomyces sp. V1I1]|uniref:gamma-glutamyltransferase family protein n=1 Tax=Streptomyces sp. V1I1 TaxID=3042272 RepID=UPI00277ECDE0|nr:gamma-glutamyltransferase [Streptomyces sp. V1I1]MDQ0939772.1 gamma-glutamyltranspeptidase/glutathione hydrolase [Streptomyces sp. V1I1]
MFTTRPTLQGTFGMVSSTHWLASQSAMAVLEDGGNAYDAAVAAGFVLHVVEPHLCGPAGEVPIILAPAGGEVRVLCGQGTAPAGAGIGHYRSLGLDLVPGTGPLAAAVPGAFDAWMVLLRDHGTKSLADVLRYAIGYAEDGHAPVERVGATVESVRELFETEWTSSAEVYLPGGKSPAPGELLRNPALAATWRRLIAESSGGGRVAEIEAARKVWSEGFIADALVRQAARPTLDTSGERHTGTLTAADLAGWSASYEAPVAYDWNGWTLCKAGGWSQGPALLQQLALLPDELPEYGSAEYVHLLIEGCKLAMADREAWYGDAAEVPLGELLSEPYNARRRALVGEKASYELRPGSPGGRTPKLSTHATAVAAGEPGFDVKGITAAGAGEPTVARNGASPLPGEPDVTADGGTRGDTCHLDIVDRWGNMVAATPSGGWLQSNPVAPELGFPLGTRLQTAWLEPGLPNSLTPGRRPRTTLALRPEVRGGLDLQGAIDAPNWHSDSFPSSFYPRGMRPGSVTVESRMDPGVIAGLRLRGHDVNVGDAWSEGRLCAVARDPRTGVLSAAANPRGMQGYAVGR